MSRHNGGGAGRRLRAADLRRLAAKGVIYYQWRADYPFPDSPSPRSMASSSDRTPTAKFETVVKNEQAGASPAPYLTRAKKARCGGHVVLDTRRGLLRRPGRIEAPLSVMTSWYRRLNHDHRRRPCAKRLAPNALQVRSLLFRTLPGFRQPGATHRGFRRGGSSASAVARAAPNRRLPEAARRRVVQLSPNPSAQEVGSLLQAAGAAPAVQAGLPAGHDCSTSTAMITGRRSLASAGGPTGAALEFDAGRERFSTSTRSAAASRCLRHAGDGCGFLLPTLRTGGFIVAHR